MPFALVGVCACVCVCVCVCMMVSGEPAASTAARHCSLTSVLSDEDESIVSFGSVGVATVCAFYSLAACGTPCNCTTTRRHRSARTRSRVADQAAGDLIARRPAAGPCPCRVWHTQRNYIRVIYPSSIYDFYDMRRVPAAGKSARRGQAGLSEFCLPSLTVASFDDIPHIMLSGIWPREMAC